MEAIRKVEAMQTYNGGIMFWPGGGRVNWWGSIYAAHFLHEAQQAGYEVNSKVFDNLLKYIKNKAKRNEYEEYFYRKPNGTMVSQKLVKKEIPYSIYLLALIGQPDISLMNYYKSIPDQLSVDGKYLLAGAFMLIGDMDGGRSLIPDSFGNQRSIRSSGGSFYSYIRDLAISLNTLLEVDPDNQNIGMLSRTLSQEIKARRWLSTQETAFSLLALGKISKKAAQSNIEAFIEINGEFAGEFLGNDLVITDDINNSSLLIKTKNEGNLYYFYELEGISASGRMPEKDENLEVRKVFYDRFGNQLTSNTFDQNDLVVIKVSLRSTLLSEVENVAVTDLLPACFEIENPRITPTRELQWIKDKNNPEYMDIRDDRIIFFTEAGTGWKHFYYMVRAVSKGEYFMGHASAEAMYDGQYHSVSGARTITVK
jgi:uncharacterized protein YfaS (alpha-2-macroglobulin family)